jgi:hypothetical protein
LRLDIVMPPDNSVEAAEKLLEATRRYLKESRDAVAKSYTEADDLIGKSSKAVAEAKTTRAQIKEGAAEADNQALRTKVDVLVTSANDNIKKATVAILVALAGDKKDEWKECRATIDRFDKLLVDLRKTAFGLVTALVGAATFVFAQAAPGGALLSIPLSVKIAVLAMLGLLIVSLYYIDRVHQAWLKVTVDRACVLETEHLGFELTNKIGQTFRGKDAYVLGIALYLILLFATCAIFWFAIPLQEEYVFGGHRNTIYLIFVVGALLILGSSRVL